MNKILISVALLFFCGNLQAQQSTHTTTLFEYGEPVISSEANFRNLFQNFPKFVTNANRGIKLLSYKHIAVIKNRGQIKGYLKKNTKVYMAGGPITMAMGEDSIQSEKYFIKIEFSPPYEINKRINKAFLKDLKEKLETIAGNIHSGDDVYVLNFTADSTPYEFYMFVNPQTSTLLKEGNFLGFQIPVYYADFHSRKQVSE